MGPPKRCYLRSQLGHGESKITHRKKKELYPGVLLFYALHSLQTCFSFDKTGIIGLRAN